MHTTTTLSRRDFVKTAAGLAMTASAVMPQLSGLAASTTEHWTVACRDGHLKATGKPDCWQAMKELGIAGVEVTVDDNLNCPNLYHPTKKYNVATAEGIQSLQTDLQDNGQALTAFCMANRFEERLERELVWAGNLVKAAQKMKVNAIRIDVVPRSLSAEQFLSFSIQACKKLCEIVEATPIRFGIENHGRVTNDPVFLEKLFDGAGSSHLGLTLDPCNFYWFGHPLNTINGIIEKFASRAFHTHCKSIRYPEDKRDVRRAIGWEYDKYSATIYDGDLDYAAIAGILRKAKYGGDLCLENECIGKFPQAQRGELLKREIDFLKKIA